MNSWACGLWLHPHASAWDRKIRIQQDRLVRNALPNPSLGTVTNARAKDITGDEALLFISILKGSRDVGTGTPTACKIETAYTMYSTTGLFYV